MSGDDMREAKARCEAVLRRQWDGQEPTDEDAYHRYLVEFEYTYETYQAILLAIRAYPTVNRITCMLPPERG